MENVTVDPIGLALAVALVALVKELWPKLSREVLMGSAVAVCLAVHFGAKYIPPELMAMITAVVGPTGGVAFVRQLAGKFGTSTTPTPPTTPAGQ